MCSVLDQQLELVPANIVIDDAFIIRRIQTTWDYFEEIARSGRSRERKQELLDSAIGTLMAFLDSCDLNMQICMAIAIDTLVMRKECIQQLKPKIKNYEAGHSAQHSEILMGDQSDIRQVGQYGMEIQSLEPNRVDITHHIRSGCWDHRRRNDGFEGYLRDHQGV